MNQIPTKIRIQDIQQIMHLSDINRLSQLNQNNLTLQYQPINRFQRYENNMMNSKNNEQNICKSSSQQTANKKMTISTEDSAQSRKTQQSKSNYYSIVKMLFAQIDGVPPLDIDIMDTIFYNPDNSMTYVYTDLKRGLIKTKTKNYIQLFFKRKAQVDQYQRKSIIRNDSRSNQGNQQDKDILNSYETKYQYLRRYKYVALLQYKDQNFIRLKQNQFKQIFIRPVQANQKYKIWNNTAYIQLIPQQVNYQESTIFTIQFQLQIFKNTGFFNKVVGKHCQQTSYRNSKQSRTTKQLIKQISLQAYLLYIIFQLYSYITVHYHKQLNFGIFQFMKVKDTFYLSNITKIKLNSSQNLQKQYARSQLFEQFIDFSSNYNNNNNNNNNKYKYKQTNAVYKTIQQILDKQNSKIRIKVQNIIRDKVEGVYNRKDVIQSNYIFQSINTKCKHNLHYLLENESEYQKFLKKKQKQLNGFSPLTSISNIKKKKIKLNNTKKQQEITRQQRQSKDNKYGLKKHQQMFENFINPKKQRPITSKWCKKQLYNKKLFYISLSKL